MDAYEKLNELILEKQSELKTENDHLIMKDLLELVKDKGCFFKIPAKLTVGFILFLGVPREEALDFYRQLVSFKEYQKRMPKKYMSVKRRQ